MTSSIEIALKDKIAALEAENKILLAEQFALFERLSFAERVVERYANAGYPIAKQALIKIKESK